MCGIGSLPGGSAPFEQVAGEGREQFGTLVRNGDGLAHTDAVFAVLPHRRDDVKHHARLEFPGIMVFQIHNMTFAPSRREADADAVPDAFAERRLVAVTI